ncbi:hypothetical protein B0H14DRAFT_2586524 [Mycena olivaceomarginata]|nr:hypothetical protein B0H14DRAFT_2586524 [Mycena olivaceomarginata]
MVLKPSADHLQIIVIVKYHLQTVCRPSADEFNGVRNPKVLKDAEAAVRTPSGSDLTWNFFDPLPDLNQILIWRGGSLPPLQNFLLLNKRTLLFWCCRLGLRVPKRQKVDDLLLDASFVIPNLVCTNPCTNDAYPLAHGDDSDDGDDGDDDYHIPLCFALDIRHKTTDVADIENGSNYHPPRMLKGWTEWAGLYGGPDGTWIGSPHFRSC